MFQNRKRKVAKSETRGNVQKLIVSHFYNEAYLLPWWLEHHREMFDHGILIDNHSTDRSVEICRELVPDWEIVTSANEAFSGIMCDFEVMKHEERYPDAWKIVLNTTEFLVGGQLDNIINHLHASGSVGGRISGAVMVDANPEVPPLPDMPLVAQKHYGVREEGFPFETLDKPWYRYPTRTRLLHRYKIGAYKPGRHESSLPNLTNIRPEHLEIWWYGFSPWTPEGRARKLQIGTTVDAFDRSVGFGHQHMVDERELNARHAAMLEFASEFEVPLNYKPRPLKLDP